jgi:hypothetical protein
MCGGIEILAILRHELELWRNAKGEIARGMIKDILGRLLLCE